MQSTEQSLSNELQQNLLGQLSVTEWHEIDQLNDFRNFMQETKEVLHAGGRLEAEKSKLNNRLNNHLYRSKELEATLLEISMENRRKLDKSYTEVFTKNRIQNVNKNVKDLEQKFEKLTLSRKIHKMNWNI
ncbi:hypothetical protein NPIL_694821 [Nephila pilipes]|uniref:Uncharacterized protein n=1 Tax=Nephila pilipes TaxID=299642 RepID=A0A8X6P7E8_NEPPI|nr:hypothetical protein NPIL_694821 [Nephila pilipes]